MHLPPDRPVLTVPSEGRTIKWADKSERLHGRPAVARCAHTATAETRAHTADRSREKVIPMSKLFYEHTDASQNATTALFIEEASTTTSHWIDSPIEVEGYVAVGGGAMVDSSESM